MPTATIRIFSLFLLIGSIFAAKYPKIIGGKNASIQHFPYLVSIREDGEHSCGGSIISDRHILTAAHCMDYVAIESLTVHSGTSQSKIRGTVHKILSAHVHPEYKINDDENGYPNDIAVLTLKDPIEFNKRQKKIDLPTHEVQSHQVGYVIGWGRISTQSGRSAEQLQKLQVALLPSDICKSLVTHTIRPEQVCAFRSTISGACHGDSGGPLVSHGKIVGIVSYGDVYDCAAGIPDIYTAVFAYRDFIKSIMNE